MTKGVSTRHIRAAFRALDALMATPGRARNTRLEILRKYRRNLPLKIILSAATSSQAGSKYLLPSEHPPGSASGRISQSNFRTFTCILRAARKGSLAPRTFYATLENFYSRCSPNEAAIYHQVLTQKLKVGVAQKLGAKVWSEFAIQLPKSSDQPSDGIRLFFFVDRGSCVNALTMQGRSYPLLAGRFQSINKLGRNLVFEGVVRSTVGFPLLDKFLHSNIKTIGAKEQFLFFYHSLRLTVTAAYELDTCALISKRKLATILRKYRACTRTIRNLVRIDLKL